jgi:hypothetical protein
MFSPVRWNGISNGSSNMHSDGVQADITASGPEEPRAVCRFTKVICSTIGTNLLPRAAGSWMDY